MTNLLLIINGLRAKGCGSGCKRPEAGIKTVAALRL